MNLIFTYLSNYIHNSRTSHTLHLSHVSFHCTFHFIGSPCMHSPPHNRYTRWTRCVRYRYGSSSRDLDEVVKQVKEISNIQLIYVCLIRNTTWYQNCVEPEPLFTDPDRWFLSPPFYLRVDGNLGRWYMHMVFRSSLRFGRNLIA